jgi:carboxyl-terminal processing protease
MRLLLFLSVLIAGTTQYSWGQASAGDTAVTPCLEKAHHLLDEAFVFMQKNYYRKNAVEWNRLIGTAKTKLNSSGNCNETYDILSWCFKELNESHSFIMSPERAALYNNGVSAVQQKPSLHELVGDIKGELLDDGIAYLTVPWVKTTDSAICTLIADSIQQVIAGLDALHPNGWIIDLRTNTGGNCWPMLAGIGPLLGNGVCGYFVTPREKIAISYNNGTAAQGKYLRCRVSKPAHQLQTPHQPIIVLTGNSTVSSGEIVALAFKGKAEVFFYGEPTAGYTTANATYTLSDNSMLVLSVCQEADRTGKIYEGRIMPDQMVSINTHPGAVDPARCAAMERLVSQRNNPQ